MSSSRFGRISSVFVDGDDNDVFVSVVTGPNREPRRMRFDSPYKGAWYVPMEGDIVEVRDVNGTRIASTPANNGPSIPTDLSEGDFCFRFNDETELRFSKQPNGTFNVDVTADGTVTVDAPSVNLGKQASKALSFNDHTHSVTLSDGSTATTGEPNEPGTTKTTAE